jgi:endopeptidase La
MTDLNIKKYIILYLKKNYYSLSNLLIKIINSCEKNNLYNIINNTDRNKIILEINSTLNLLNNTFEYKQNIVENNYNNLENNENEKYIKKIFTLFNREILDEKISKYIKENVNNMDDTDILNLLLQNNIIFNIFTKYFNYEDIQHKIKEIICNYGFLNISEILKLFYMKQNDFITNMYLIFNNNDNNLLKLLDDIFNPLNVKLISNDLTKINNNVTIEIKQNINTEDNYQILLNNYYIIIIFTNDNKKSIILEICGYFNFDSLGALTTTLKFSNQLVNKKIEEIKDLLFKSKRKSKIQNKINSIPFFFKENYLKYLTIGSILSFKPDFFSEKIFMEYELYIKYSDTVNFKILLEDFIKSNLITKFNLIKILLLSSDNQLYNANHLFSISKENKNGSLLISEIIYKNLHYDLQIKLKKINENIKLEIEKFNNIEIEDIDIKKQIILNNNIPQKVKKIALEKLEEMKNGNSEYSKHLEFVRIIANYPWNTNSKDDIFSAYPNNIDKWKEIMQNTTKKINDIVYGHKECKDTIIELLGKWFSNPNSMGKAIGLKGPPGVGKTLIAKGLGYALNIPFTQINLGGKEDSSILIGHSITYSGAIPGSIVTNMVEAKKARCIMFFDELDKTSCKHGKNEIFNVLIHAIDSTTNSEFNDNFFQNIKFPINKVLFVFSFNDEDKIDPILLDRIEIINVNSYTIEDKLKICNEFLLKEVGNDIGLTNLKIDDETLLYIIENHTHEAGVRGLKRKLEKIILKINKDKIYGLGIFAKKSPKNIIITKDLIDEYLSKSNISIKKIHTISDFGIVNGLYASSYGIGGIVPILIYSNYSSKNGKFILKLTGNQKKVMRESIEFAFTIACNTIKKDLCKEFFENEKYGFHIHTPDGATPKDGPSAGAAFTLAFISKILNKKIKNTIAMTGEIEINGNITAIGGLTDKLDGAKKAGVKFVFIPTENKSDLDKILENNNKLFDDNFKYKLVNHITEVAEYGLIDDKYIIDILKDITFDQVFNVDEYLRKF